MRALLVRPHPGNDRFGLGPFFRVEPLGLEYVAAALAARGHQASIADLRFRPSLDAWLRRARPDLVGISAMHALEFDQALALARRIRGLAPGAFILAGGHAGAAFPAALEDDALDAVALDDGEEIAPLLADALQAGRPVSSVPALRLRARDGWTGTAPLPGRTGLDAVPLPARPLVERFRRRYHCLLFRPVWAVETARGCPFRCSFCSVWELYGRSFRERSVGAAADDLAASGPHVFVVDDLFFHPPERSLALAREVLRRGVRKRWMLVQSRCDLVARHPDLLEAWRPAAEEIDVFFGLEAASDSGLAGLAKDAAVEDTLEAARIARALGYQVTGNFVVDPDWDEDRFRELWDFVAAHGFQRAGYTILTPLPGTSYYDRMRPRLGDPPWYTFDMHHALWEPRLGARRFFELYAETWRRSILNLRGRKRWADWARQVGPAHVPYITRLLLRTQRMMRATSYLREHSFSVRTSLPARP